MCHLTLTSLPSLVPRIPYSQFVPWGRGVGREVRRMHGAQVPRVCSLISKVPEASGRRSGVHPYGDGHIGLGV